MRKECIRKSGRIALLLNKNDDGMELRWASHKLQSWPNSKIPLRKIGYWAGKADSYFYLKIKDLEKYGF